MLNYNTLSVKCRTPRPLLKLLGIFEVLGGGKSLTLEAKENVFQYFSQGMCGTIKRNVINSTKA